ncbi:PUB domain protein [Nannochloropsis gaditana]|uniref:PUB domain protein n=1 Tax=Nannochloropsis gaditana TaxID=72520 RepID=W7TC07_9STRA|nr:PUB domain protein [Nannochloropsis gaditana]
MDKADGDDGKIVIKVKTLKGGGENSVSLKVVPNMTIGELKAQIAASALEVPCESQRLVFQGCMLKDDRKTLAEHKLTEGSCVLLSVLSPSVSNRGSSASPSIASPASSLPSNPSPNNPTSLPSPVIPSPSSTASPAVVILRAAITGVRSSNSPEVGTLALQTLSTMLGNIIANPMEEKFRQFKKSNPAFLRRVGSASGTGAILRAAGFQESAQTWVLQPSEQGWGVLCTAKGEIDAAIAALPPSLPPPGPGASGRQPAMAGLGGGLEGGGGGGRGARMDPTMLATLMGMMQSNPALRAQALRLFGASDGPGQARSVEALLNNPALVNQLAQQYEVREVEGGGSRRGRKRWREGCG